ncbi:MAG TPA: ABC transporter ATP-binding protein [Steroidobacteraceae bacterium]|nr:ABC transporter ATP-binding protein [Steroidobacteraceae bacterium]
MPEQQKIKWATVRRTLGVAAPHSGMLLLFLVVVVVGSSIGIAYPLIYRAIINEGILKQNAALIIRLAVMIAGLGVLDAALGLGQTYLATRVGAEVVVSLRTKLFDHIQRMPLAFFSRTQTGALVSRLITDATGARSAFTDVLSNVAGNSVTVCLIFGALFALSWRITLIVLILLPVFVLPARYWGRRIREVTREAFSASAAMASTMVERFNVAGALLSKLFGRPSEDVQAFEVKAQTLSRTGITAAMYGRLLAMVLTLTATLATALAYGWGGVLASQHRLDLGTVVAIVSLLARLYAPLMGLSNVQVNVMTALVSFERIFEILDLQPMIRERPDALTVPQGPIRLTFDNVFFHYPMAAEVSLASLESIAIPEKRVQRTVLHDVSFSAEPGQLVALVGSSGSGKTTITHLIPRLYDPQTGFVRLNGVDVRDTTLESLRARIGVVTQDAHLFHDTLRANLQYARPGANDEDIRAALGDAQILDVVEALPDGLDTMVGERGYRFSGGEKQRLAIARLLLKAPDLVILDEATAHLDSVSETKIQRALEQALSQRTSIVIAHRLSTVVRADQILVLQDGRIVDRGTHAQLMAKGGAYAELYQRQFATAAPET